MRTASPHTGGKKLEDLSLEGLANPTTGNHLKKAITGQWEEKLKKTQRVKRRYCILETSKKCYEKNSKHKKELLKLKYDSKNKKRDIEGFEDKNWILPPSSSKDRDGKRRRKSIKITELVQEVQKLNYWCLTKKKEADGRKIINILHTFKTKLNDKSFQMERAQWVLTQWKSEMKTKKVN